MAAAMPCKRKARSSNTKVAARRGIHFIDSRSKLEKLVDAAMPCKKEIHTCNRKLAEEVTASHKVPKDTRQSMGPSLPKKHEDLIVGKGYNSMAHNKLVHKFIPMPQAMKIPDAKAAVNSKRIQHGN